MAELKLTGVRKAYGSVKVLHGIDLHIRSGEFIVFVGPSGCGKSTLLRLIAGLEEITDGMLTIDGETVNDKPPSARGIAMVFQSYALYPHMNVYDNMAFGLKLAKSDRAEIDRRVRAAAEMLKLTPYLARLPKQLSGGQRQRVAIGRAIVRDPKVFLFDEPLSNLDAALRVAMRLEIAKLHERMKDTTMIYVTHDQVEAMTLADRIVVLNAGCIEQVGSPMELYRKPDNLFVARFIGSPAMNTVSATVVEAGENAKLRIKDGPIFTTSSNIPSAYLGKSVTLGVRPEDLRPTKAQGLFHGPISIVEKLGEVTLLYIENGETEPLVVKVGGDEEFRRGDTLHVTAAPHELHVFGEDGKAFPLLVAVT